MRNSYIHNFYLNALVYAVIGAAISTPAIGAALNTGDILTIRTGVKFGGETNGSYFAIDTDGDGLIGDSDKTILSQGTVGVVIGATTTAGASHAGPPQPGDTNAVTAPDQFLGNTGSWYFDVAPTGSTESGLDMSGWDWAWTGVPSFGLGGLAWQPANCDDLGCSGYTFISGVGRFQWDGVYGHSYTLDTTSAVPPGDPSGAGGSQFYTHLEGTVNAVPEPAPVWMFGAALLVMLGAASRRRT